LRKDFTIDEYQIYEARMLDADAILLIVALMDGGQLGDFQGIGREMGLGVLVEVHTADELSRAVDCGSSLIGINNRDLNTFETNLDTTFEMLEKLPSGVTAVSESGIDSREDVERLEQAGLDAILVGESLMRSADIGAKVREMLGK
jgi:indole-3-glycerol phosphate synthase